MLKSVSFISLMAVLAKERNRILGSGLVFALAGLLLSVFIAPQFRSSVTTLPSEPIGEGYSSNVLNRGAGILDLFTGPSQNNANVLEALATLNTDGFLLEFIRSNEIDHYLFAADWDASKAQWRLEEGALDRLSAWAKKSIYGFHNIDLPPLGPGPTADEILKAFRKAVVVDLDADLGVVKVGIVWGDPQLSADWANGLVRAVNNFLRAARSELLESRISVLMERLSAQSLVTVKLSLSNEVAKQTSLLALTQVSNGYALRVLDDARPSQTAVYPNRLLIFFGGLILGLTLAALIVIYRRFLREK